MNAELTIGFTQSDRASDYCSFDDGYRPGARQELVTLTVNAGGLPEMTAEEWGDAVFEATNAPIGGRPGATRRIVDAIAVAHQAGHARRMRSLSVGDTVAVGTERVSCEKRGWAPAPFAAEEPLPRIARGDLVTLEGCTTPAVFRVVSVDRGGVVPLAFVAPADGSEDGQWIAVGSLELQSSLGAL